MSTAFLILSNGGRAIEERWLWRNLTLEVAPGDRVAITGPSGSGKTLLLRCLAGLDALDEGQITCEGRPLDAWSLPSYRAQVSYVPQTPAFVEGTVSDNLQRIFDFEVHAGKAYDEDVILNMLTPLDMESAFLEREVKVLSGGEQQIVALVRALQIQPQVLLLDEPTANVDATRTDQIEQLLERWQQAHKEVAYLWTSHDADQITRVTGRQVDLEQAVSSVPS